LRSVSIIASRSWSVTVATGRSMVRSDNGCNRISGSTSNTAAYLRSAPGSIAMGSMRGPLAGFNFSRATASEKDARMRSLITSP
jgi:hypothetical protein